MKKRNTKQIDCHEYPIIPRLIPLPSPRSKSDEPEIVTAP